MYYLLAHIAKNTIHIVKELTSPRDVYHLDYVRAKHNIIFQMNIMRQGLR